MYLVGFGLGFPFDILAHLDGGIIGEFGYGLFCRHNVRSS